MDTITGTAANDTINATNTTTSTVLGGLDSVDGGAGTDTLNIADTATAANAAFSLPAGFSVKNVEKLNITTNGSVGDSAGGAGTTQFDTTGMTGLTTVNTVAAGLTAGGGSWIKVADTVDLTMTNAKTAKVWSDGGKTVTIDGGTTIAATSKAMTLATLKNITNGGTVQVNNTDAAGTLGAGTTLTSVTLDKVDNNSAVQGQGIANLTVNGATSATRTVTVTNSTANHALTINATGTGIDSASATSAFLAGGTVVTDTVATAMTINSKTTKNSLDITNSTAVKTLTIVSLRSCALFSNHGITVTIHTCYNRST